MLIFQEMDVCRKNLASFTGRTAVSRQWRGRQKNNFHEKRERYKSEEEPTPHNKRFQAFQNY